MAEHRIAVSTAIAVTAALLGAVGSYYAQQARLETKMSEMREHHATREELRGAWNWLAEQRATLAAHEERLRALERRP